MHRFPVINRRIVDRVSSLCLLGALTWVAVASTSIVAAQEPAFLAADLAPDLPVVQFEKTQPGMLRFSFNGAPWRQVIDWLSDESNMALHVGDLPSGSFTYSDPGEFTVDQAIARVNLFLIPQGYSVVRRDNLLSVINLGDPRSIQQLDAMAPLTSVDRLSGLSEHEVVKCMIPLGELDSEEAIAELKPLSMMTTPVTLPRSNQLMITDTVTRMKSALSVLDAMRSDLREPSVVKRFDLKYADVETVMLVAGTHLDLDAGQMSGVDLSISTDLSGKRLFVTGNPDKVERLEQLLTVIDVDSEIAEEPQDLILESHAVTAGNLSGVYDVLQTILAGQSIRLSMEPSTSSIVALADAPVHDKIRATIKELRAPAVEFAVVDLNSIDPFFAITLIGEMFDIPSEFEDRDEDDEKTTAPPKVDADPDNRRLFVRGTKDQVVQIEQLIRSLDSPARNKTEVRIIPLRGRDGQKVLDLATRSWNGGADLKILPPSDSVELDIIEKAIHPDSSVERQETADHDPLDIKTTANKQADSQALIAHTQESSESPTEVDTVENSGLFEPHSGRARIQTRLTPAGIEIQSRDTEALGDFESYLRTLATEDQNTISPPTAYYLKYVGTEEAVQMLADLIDGENSLATSPSGSLVNGGSISSRGNSYFGSLLFKRDGATTMTTGSATIVSDARLNRLIVQGTTKDIEMVERYLELIDKGDSIIGVEKGGQSHVVQLFHTKAEDVAEVIRQAFIGRIAKDENQNRQPGREERPRGDDNEQRGEEGRPQRPVEKPTRGREPEMAIAVHEPSNTLVITAPDQLFAEVKKLIDSVDQRSEQFIQIIPASEGVHLEAILKGMMGQEVESRQRNDSRKDDSRRDDRRSRSRN